MLDGSVAGVKQQFKENLQHRAEGNGEPGTGSFAEAIKVCSRSKSLRSSGQQGRTLIVRSEGHRPNDVLSYFINEGRNITTLWKYFRHSTIYLSGWWKELPSPVNLHPSQLNRSYEE